MGKLHNVVEETLMSYSDLSTINVMMFGSDEETKQIIDDYPSTNVVTIDNMSHYSVDIIICAHNVTQEEMDDISDLVKTQFSETVIIEESENDELLNKDKVSIHQNKYEHFTYFDDDFPNIIVYSQTDDITSAVGSSLGILTSYTGINISGVSTQSAPLTNVPFSIVGGRIPLSDPDDLDDHPFGFDDKGE